MRCLGWVSLLLVVSSSAHAGTWGESWGSMVWGAVVAVPSLGWVGGALLVSLLVGLAWWRKPGRTGAALGLLLALGFAPVAEAQTVSVPNTLSNGSVAEAPAMNANFDAVLNGVNAALTTGPVSLPNTFTNGTTADADEVNANFTAVVDGVNTALANRATDCAGAGGTWDGASCTPLPCDVTSNDAAILESVCTETGGSSYNENSNTCGGLTPLATCDSLLLDALLAGCVYAGGVYDGVTCTPAPTPESNDETICASAGGTWDGASCIAAPTPESNDEAICTSAGGTWDAGASTCTPGAGGGSYNCFVGAFCSLAAIEFPPATYGYTNVYAGHTQTTEPASGAGCNASPGSSEWNVGSHTSDWSARVQDILSLCGSN